MVVVSTVPIPYRFIALMQKCNRLFAYPLELLAGEIRATGFQCSCCGTCCTRSVNGHIFLLDHDVTPLFSYNDIAILLTDRTGCDIFQFHPVLGIYSFRISPEQRSWNLTGALREIQLLL